MEPEELLNEDSSSEESKKESPLVSLEADLKFFNESIREVAIEIMVEGLSNYPILLPISMNWNWVSLSSTGTTSIQTGASMPQQWKNL